MDAQKNYNIWSRSAKLNRKEREAHKAFNILSALSVFCDSKLDRHPFELTHVEVMEKSLRIH